MPLIPAQSKTPCRIALIGIGHPFLSDDQAGLLVVRSIKKELPAKLAELVLCIEAGSNPENFLGPITRFAPDHMLLIDAVLSNQVPGSVLQLDWQPGMNLDYQPFSLPLDKFCQFIHTETKCTISIIGIQAAKVSYGSQVSQDVEEAIEIIKHQLISELVLRSNNI